jgi:hypothetical protein
VIKSEHSRTFERLVAQRRQEVIESIIAGNLLAELIGHIRGFDEAIKLSEQADRLLNGEDE